jgi:uncharacterized protein YndB with AHSA1/START domain
VVDFASTLSLVRYRPHMPEAHDTSRSPDSVTVRVGAPPERVYEIVSDVSRMGELSPECTGGRWLGGATGPTAGARFKGTNRRGWVRWSTTNEVVAAEPGREFTFDTKQSGTRWSFTMEPDGDGTLVTESRSPWRDRPFVAKAASTLLLGGMEEHEEEMRQGLQATLERLKAVAEAG